GHRMKALLKRVLDPAEFLSPHGVRSLSRVHLEQPYMLDHDGVKHMVTYDPAESTSGLFGGNSNWRGPVWFPVNYLLIEALQKFHHYYGDEFVIENPTGSGEQMTIAAVAVDLSRRLANIFLRDESGQRPVFAGRELEGTDPVWGDAPLFYEYFHGDSGAGLGASHQTGWTALVAKLLEQSGHHGGPLPSSRKPAP
ncbi:MAG: glucosidase, partial [Tepidiformaceae bacterium]